MRVRKSRVVPTGPLAVFWPMSPAEQVGVDENLAMYSSLKSVHQYSS